MITPGIPRHEQISNWIREQVVSGAFEPHDKLPSESKLGKLFGVSRITVRHALQTAQTEGLIYRRQGLGSFVQDHRTPEGSVGITDFGEDLAEAGLRSTSQVVFHGPDEPSEEVIERLGLTTDLQVVRLDRLRFGNGKPIAYDQTWLPLFYGRLLVGSNLEQDSITDVFQNDYNIPIVSGRFRLEATIANAEVASHLNLEPGGATLLITSTSSTSSGKRVYFQRRYYNSSLVSYELEMERSQELETGMLLSEFEAVFSDEMRKKRFRTTSLI